VEIPPGVPDGVQLRVPSRGLAGDAGAPPGDLYVAVHVRPHERFAREGDDILFELPISFTQAVLGAEVEVPTLDGPVTVTIPPGTSSHQKLRLRGKGAPRPDGRRGDQYAEVKIVVPSKVDEKAAELIREFSRRAPVKVRR